MLSVNEEESAARIALKATKQTLNIKYLSSFALVVKYVYLLSRFLMLPVTIKTSQ